MVQQLLEEHDCVSSECIHLDLSTWNQFKVKMIKIYLPDEPKSKVFVMIVIVSLQAMFLE